MRLARSAPARLAPRELTMMAARPVVEQESLPVLVGLFVALMSRLNRLRAKAPPASTCLAKAQPHPNSMQASLRALFARSLMRWQ